MSGSGSGRIASSAESFRPLRWSRWQPRRAGPDGPDAPGALKADIDGDEMDGDLLQPGDAVLLIENEFSFGPDDLVVAEGAYSGELVNEDKIAHNVTFDGGESFDVAMSSPGTRVPVWLR